MLSICRLDLGCCRLSYHHFACVDSIQIAGRLCCQQEPARPSSVVQPRVFCGTLTFQKTTHQARKRRQGSLNNRDSIGDHLCYIAIATVSTQSTRNISSLTTLADGTAACMPRDIWFPGAPCSIVKQKHEQGRKYWLCRDYLGIVAKKTQTIILSLEFKV